jgi:hypothetical protein
MPGRAIQVNLHPRYRGAWHGATREAAQARQRRRERLGLILVTLILAATILGAVRAGFDAGATVMLGAGSLVLLLSAAHPMALWSRWNSDLIGRRRRGRGMRLILLVLGLGLTLAGAGREALLRRARADCTAALRRLSSGAGGAAVLTREPYSGIRGWLIYDRRPRRCADLIRMGDAI